MYFFLDKEDQHKVELFTFLESLPNQIATNDEVKKELDFSTFLLRKTFDGLRNDFIEFNLEEAFEITQVDKKITLNRLKNVTISVLMWHYLDRSDVYRLFKHCLAEDIDSVEEFSTIEYISTTKTYNIRTTLEEWLGRYNITISKNMHLSGPEKNIRTLSNLFFTCFNGLYYPFGDSLQVTSNSLVNKISEIIHLSESQKIKFSYFVSFILLRLDKNHPLPINHSPELVLLSKSAPELTPTLFTFFQEETQLSDEQIMAEIYFIYNFMYAESFPIETRYEQLDISRKQRAEIELLESMFIEAINQHFYQEKTNFFCSPELREALRHINLKLILFPPMSVSPAHRDNLNFFKENYHDYSQIISLLMTNLTKIQKRFSQNEIESALYYPYFFELIRYFPLETIIPPIYICVDFSDSLAYNAYIQKNIASFNYLNLVIQDQLTEETDLYLSNIFIPNLDCPILLWNSPPTSADWTAFGNLILDIKQQKGETR